MQRNLVLRTGCFKSPLRVLLIGVALGLLLGACVPGAPAKSAETPVRPVASRTLKPTTTPKPIPTIVPTPTFEMKPGMVKVAEGIVFAENGKVMLVGKDGVANKTDLSKLTFYSAVDAGPLVAALNPAYYTEDQIALLDHLIPPGQPMDRDLKAVVTDKFTSTSFDFGYVEIPMLGEIVAATTVFDTANNVDFIVLFYAVYGSHKPVPVITAWVDHGSGEFHQLAGPRGLYAKSSFRASKPTQAYVPYDYRAVEKYATLVGVQGYGSILIKLTKPADDTSFTYQGKSILDRWPDLNRFLNDNYLGDKALLASMWSEPQYANPGQLLEAYLNLGSGDSELDQFGFFSFTNEIRIFQ